MRKACERPDDERLSTWVSLLEAHAVLMDKLERELTAAGGPPLAFYDVMVQLQDAPDHRLTMKQLADAVLLSKSGVTRLVDRMMAAGYVTRDSCATDRRVVYAKLTSKGLNAFKKAMPKHLGDIERSFSRHLTDTEARTLRNVFEKLLEAARSDDLHGAATG